MPASAKRSSYLARLLSGGFILAPIVAWSGTATAADYTGGAVALITTTTGATTTTGGVVALIMLLVRGGKDKPNGKDEASLASPDDTLAARLTDAAILGDRSELGLLLEASAASPAAFTQMSAELERGSGAGAEALAQALSLPVPVVADAWSTARASVGAVGSAEDAQSVVCVFLGNVVADARPSEADAGRIAWSAAREAAAGDEGPTLNWFAEWLGVPTAEVAVAARAVSSEHASGAQLREAVQGDGRAFLHAVATRVEHNQGAAVASRYAALQVEAERVLAGLKHPVTLASAG